MDPYVPANYVDSWDDVNDILDEVNTALRGSTPHPAALHVLQFFKFDHLPEHLQKISKPFHDLAHTMVKNAPNNPETTIGLRKLLEAKDCFVRAALPPTKVKPNVKSSNKRKSSRTGSKRVASKHKQTPVSGN